MSVEQIELIAYTHPDVYSYRRREVAYDRIRALRCAKSPDHHVGVKNVRRMAERQLYMAPIVGHRLFQLFNLNDGWSGLSAVNCHYATRFLHGLALSGSPPATRSAQELTATTTLSPGAAAVIAMTGQPHPHSIAFGMGAEGLQMMSYGGELGIADNTAILEFYRSMFSDREVRMCEFEPIRPEQV